MKSRLNKYRRALILLPLVATMCVIIIYLMTGIFKYQNSQLASTDTLSRLNTRLPEPNIKDKDKNKLEIYMQNEEDSLKKQNERDNPSLKRFFDPGPPEENPFTEEMPPKKGPSVRRDLATQEKKVNDQLNKILKELNSTSVESDAKPGNSSTITSATSTDIGRIEQLMSMLYADTAGDPELQRLDGMLDKILRIQHPDAFNNKSLDDDSTTNLISQHPEQIIQPTTVFYGLEQNMTALSKQKMAIRAVVHVDQTLQAGSTIKLRLLENIYIGQQEIPAGTFVYGVCNISDERLTVNLNKIVHNNVIIPVKLTAYDTDGIEGIAVPGAITRDAAKQGLDRTLQSLSLNTLDPSMAAQVTSAGIQSLKTMLSRKVKQIKVTVKAGHQVFLQ
jgi:Protein of unknown function (DUF3714).